MHRRAKLNHQNRIKPSDFSMQMLAPMEETVAQEMDDNNEKIQMKQKLEQDYFVAYKPANYQRALKYKNEHSYKQKNHDGSYVRF